MTTIKDIQGRMIIDSRGNPTVEADVILEDGSIGRAAVPSGASTGTKEAIELRDKDKKQYLGKGVNQAVKNIIQILKASLIGKNASNQKNIDKRIMNLNGMDIKGN